MKKTVPQKLNADEEPGNVTGMDFSILAKQFGERKAARIILRASALNKEARQRIGADEPEQATKN